MAARFWGQSVQVHWVPSLRFYEERVAILRTLELQGQLTAFRMKEGEIAALVGDPHHELVVSPRHLQLSISTPEADAERLEKVAGIVCSALEPSGLVGLDVTLQQLLPLSMGYDEARQKYSETMLASWTSDFAIEDVAVLSDGVSRQGIKYQFEFGIVSQQEIPPRLRRTVGRMRASSGTTETWNIQDIPEVALFIDWTWYGVPPSKADKSAKFLTEFWKTARDEAGLLAEKLESALMAAEVTTE